MKKILHLTLEKRYFDAIAMRRKTLEFREVKEHWIKRFFDKKGSVIKFDEIHFRNGYRRDSPFMRVKWNGWHIHKQGKVNFYALDVKTILEIKNWKKEPGEVINCPINEQTGDKVPVGRCWCYLKDGKTCSRHGDVSKAIDYLIKTGKLMLELDFEKQKSEDVKEEVGS